MYSGSYYAASVAVGIGQDPYFPSGYLSLKQQERGDRCNGRSPNEVTTLPYSEIRHVMNYLTDPAGRARAGPYGKISDILYFCQISFRGPARSIYSQMCLPLE